MLSSATKDRVHTSTVRLNLARPGSVDAYLGMTVTVFHLSFLALRRTTTYVHKSGTIAICNANYFFSSLEHFPFLSIAPSTSSWQPHFHPRSPWNTRAMRSPNGEIYHLQAQYAASSQKEITDNEACTGHLSSLPPKSLPPRRGLRFALSFVMPILITVISLVVLWVLISQVRRLSPGREYGVPFAVEGIGGPVAINDTSSSCDLIPSDAGEFEKSFRIDLRGPLQLSFAQAKTIDVVWDFVIGQGGRLLLAWISYIVFMDGLARLMETSHVKYQLFVTIVFETSSVTSTWRALKAVFTGQGWRGRAFFGWFSFATIYVLGFSTLVSAATGYINPSTTHFLMKQDNVWIAADAPEFTHCLLLAQGSALGLTDNAIVYGPQAAQSPYYSPSKYPLYYNLTFPKSMLFLWHTFPWSNPNTYRDIVWYWDNV